VALCEIKNWFSPFYLFGQFCLLPDLTDLTYSTDLTICLGFYALFSAFVFLWLKKKRKIRVIREIPAYGRQAWLQYLCGFV
jgi:hypothetical protein